LYYRLIWEVKWDPSSPFIDRISYKQNEREANKLHGPIGPSPRALPADMVPH
jgi:hypothetical protein